MAQHFDAIIIGGGPGGSLAALLLARQGWRIALIERRPRNQPKTCGHCLHPRIKPVLQRAGVLDDIARITQGLSHTARLYLPNRKATDWPMSLGGDDPHLVTPRSDLDQLLIDQAQADGACIMQPASAKIRQLIRGQCEVTVNGQLFTTPLLIGADGLRSSVARAAGLHMPRDAGRKYGFSLTLPCNDATMLQQHATHMFITANGYLGIVHHDERTLHLAALVNPASHESLRHPLEFIRQTCTHHPLLAELGLREIDAATISTLVAAGPIPCCPTDVATSCTVLVGDAAGYVEPFTGEGMTWAMESADVLATVTQQLAPGTWNDAATETYRRHWQQRIAKQQRFCRLMAWSLQRPHVFRAMLSVASCRPLLTHHVLNRVLAA